MLSAISVASSDYVRDLNDDSPLYARQAAKRFGQSSCDYASSSHLHAALYFSDTGTRSNLAFSYTATRVYSFDQEREPGD